MLRTHRESRGKSDLKMTLESHFVGSFQLILLSILPVTIIHQNDQHIAILNPGRTPFVISPFGFLLNMAHSTYRVIPKLAVLYIINTIASKIRKL